jgi:hypothetical protein
MRDFLLTYWSFAPYLTLLIFLTVMSAREGKGKRNRRDSSQQVLSQRQVLGQQDQAVNAYQLGVH